MKEPLGAPDDYEYIDTPEGKYYTCIRCMGSGDHYATVEHRSSCVLKQLERR